MHKGGDCYGGRRKEREVELTLNALLEAQQLVALPADNAPGVAGGSVHVEGRVLPAAQCNPAAQHITHVTTTCFCMLYHIILRLGFGGGAGCGGVESLPPSLGGREAEEARAALRVR